ncbi:MAG: hypothetical protein F6K32_20160 [Desertifilum sp. SIO1I2]|nr:hypothetical protein [Desertifilum sp. SIO1I2]
MSQIRVFFDTNVLVYAHDRSAKYHFHSAELLKMAVECKIQGVLAEQNVIELYRIITNSTAMKGQALTSSQGENLIKKTYLESVFEIVYPVRSTVERTLQLAVQGNFISARIFDIRLAALISEADIHYFATYNISDFQGITDLNPLNPDQIIEALSS